jgi:hypothetical protein
MLVEEVATLFYIAVLCSNSYTATSDVFRRTGSSILIINIAFTSIDLCRPQLSYASGEGAETQHNQHLVPISEPGSDPGLVTLYINEDDITFSHYSERSGPSIFGQRTSTREQRRV